MGPVVAPCASNPCQNGGDCKERGGGFKCKCGPPFEGDMCEITIARDTTKAPSTSSGCPAASGKTPLFGSCYGNANIESVTKPGDCLVNGFNCDLLSETYGTLPLCGEQWSTVCPTAGSAPDGFGSYSTLKDICCEACQNYEGDGSSDFGACGPNKIGTSCDDGNAASTFDTCNSKGNCEGLLPSDFNEAAGAKIASEANPYNGAFQASKALFDTGDDNAKNMWLLPSKTEGYFTVDLGEERDIIGVKIKNTVDKDRSSEDFSIYTGNKDKDNSLKLVLSNSLQGLKGVKDIPFETFTFSEKKRARYVRFQLDSYVGKGGGLLAFFPIIGVPASSGNC